MIRFYAIILRPNCIVFASTQDVRKMNSELCISGWRRRRPERGPDGEDATEPGAGRAEEAGEGGAAAEGAGGGGTHEGYGSGQLLIRSRLCCCFLLMLL